MARRIITATFEAAGSGSGTDGFFDRVLKYIPADVVGGWVAVTGILGADNAAEDPNKTSVQWISFGAFVLLAALWTYVQTRSPGKPPAVTQVLVSTLAFAVWVFALGGPFAELDWYRQHYGSITLIVFTLAVGALVPRE